MKNIYFLLVLVSGFIIACDNSEYKNLGTLYPESYFNELFDQVEKEIKLQYSTGKYTDFIQLHESTEKRGVFVRIKKSGRQAGCIGFFRGVGSVREAVGICAVNALLFDPRFSNHLSADELTDLEIQITIIGKFIPMKNTDDFDLKYHSVLVDNGSKRAILQNTIAAEYGYDKKEFIAELDKKADINEFDRKFLKSGYYKAVSITAKKYYHRINIEK